MSPSLRYTSFLCMLLHYHILSCVFSLFSLLHVYLSLLCLNTFFFRLIPSPFLFITPRVRRLLLLQAHPQRASLMGQMSWLRPWPLLLLLHRELLLKLQFLHLSPFLPRRVPKPRGLLAVSLLLFLLRSLLLKRKSLPQAHPCGCKGKKCQSHHLVIWFRNHEYSVLLRNDLRSYYQSMGSEFWYALGKVLGTQDRPTLRLTSHHYVLHPNLIKNMFNTCIYTHTHASIHLSIQSWHYSSQDT